MGNVFIFLIVPVLNQAAFSLEIFVPSSVTGPRRWRYHHPWDSSVWWILSWSGLIVVLHSPLPLQQWGLSAGLGLDCTMTRSRHCHDCGSLMQFLQQGWKKLRSVLMVAIEWTLTISWDMESVWKLPVWKCSVWDLLLLGHLESYTKPSEIASFKMCSCICLCLNQFVSESD